MNSLRPPRGECPKVVKSDEEWRQTLTPEQYRVLRQAGTERPFGAAYEEFKKQGAGTYVCGGCGAELFSSKEKFDSHCGWPSFYDPANAKNVITRDDSSLGATRTEVHLRAVRRTPGPRVQGRGFPHAHGPALLHQRRVAEVRACGRDKGGEALRTVAVQHWRDEFRESPFYPRKNAEKIGIRQKLLCGLARLSATAATARSSRHGRWNEGGA